MGAQAVANTGVETGGNTQFFPTGRLCEMPHRVQGKLAMAILQSRTTSLSRREDSNVSSESQVFLAGMTVTFKFDSEIT